jgi:hypothetical protein
MPDPDKKDSKSGNSQTVHQVGGLRDVPVDFDAGNKGDNKKNKNKNKGDKKK